MDNVGVRELIRCGVSLARKRVSEQVAGPGGLDDLLTDARFQSVLDRFTQLGVLLLEHKVDDAWSDLLEGLLEIYRIPDFDKIVYQPRLPAEYGRYFVSIVGRVLTLGAYSVHRERYQATSKLVRQPPRRSRADYYWLRYAVTLASRAETLPQRSLIPPASEYVRSRPELFTLFGENMDHVVNRLCQFDFFHCATVIAEANGAPTDRISTPWYPSFATYWNYRSAPMAKTLIEDAHARAAAGIHSDGELAQTLVKLDSVATETAFGVNGWERGEWGDRTIEHFVQHHLNLGG